MITRSSMTDAPIDYFGGWGSRFMLLAEEANAHRETYIAIVDSVLPAVGGRAGLARKAGLTEAFVSYLRSRTYVRMPSRVAAERIAGILPLSPETRDSLVTHMMLCQEKRLKAFDDMRRRDRMGAAREISRDLVAWHRAAYTARDPAAAARLYSVVSEGARIFLSAAHPANDPIYFLDICFVLQDCLLVSNRPHQTLYLAILARSLSQRLAVAHDNREVVRRMGWNEINALRMAGVALHNLGLDRDAMGRYSEARHRAQELRLEPPLWEPYVIADTIKSASSLSRFSIRELRHLQDRAMRHLHGSPDLGNGWGVVVSASLLRAFIQHGSELSLRLASRDIEELSSLVDTVRGVGPLHRTMLLRGAAQLHLVKNDREGWRDCVTAACSTASAAGLSHQLRRIVAENGLDEHEIVEPTVKTQPNLAEWDVDGDATGYVAGLGTVPSLH